MDLTPKNKAHIDTMSVEGLLHGWRTAPAGSPWFQGETGKYWGERMAQLRSADNSAYVAASKSSMRSE